MRNLNVERLDTWVTLFAVLFLAAPAMAQSIPGKTQEHQLPIGLTEEEKTRLDEIGLYHTATAPPAPPVRRCAQWEPLTGVLIRYSGGFGLPYDIIREYAEDVTVHILCVTSQQSDCYNALQGQGVNMANVDMIDVPTNSMWVRDYGPQTVFADGEWSFTDHIYNRPRPLDDQVPWELGTAWACSVYGMDLVHTGGNLLYDGHGTGFSTDLVWDENPGLNHEEIAQMVEDYLGITDYVVLPTIDSISIRHIDCWMKLLDEETILVKEVSPDHPHYDQLEANVTILESLTNCYGRPYNIVRTLCGRIDLALGKREVAAYTNSMIVNNKIFVPLYGITTDSAAIATYEAAMPGYQVLGYSGSWYADDAIHCRTMEMPDRYMLVVDTNPLQDREFNTGDYRVSAFVDDRSEAGLVSDSLLVYWRLEGSPCFNAIVMQATADPDSYYAEIPMQADSANIDYYVFAKDNSGRRSSRPVVAPDTWYTFYTGRPADAGTRESKESVTVFRFAPNVPNPFGMVTRIRYELPRGCHIKLEIYDVLGRHIVTLVDGCQPAGSKSIQWDGKTPDGVNLPSGVYSCRLRTATDVVTTRMVILR